MSVGSKTKSYRIQGEYLLLFIFFHLSPDYRPLLLKVRPLTSWSPIQCNLSSSASGLIAFVLESIFCFRYCSYWPPSMSGPRRNLLYSWITHLHLIIHQDPSAKPAGSFRVTSGPSTLAFDIGWSWSWRPKSQACRAWLAVFSPLTRGSSWWLPDRAWVYSSCSITTDLEKRWSASSLLSCCSSVSPRDSSLRHIGFLLQKELVMMIKRWYPSWCKGERERL